MEYDIYIILLDGGGFFGSDRCSKARTQPVGLVYFSPKQSIGMKTSIALVKSSRSTFDRLDSVKIV